MAATTITTIMVTATDVIPIVVIERDIKPHSFSSVLLLIRFCPNRPPVGRQGFPTRSFQDTKTMQNPINRWPPHRANGQESLHHRHGQGADRGRGTRAPQRRGEVPDEAQEEPALHEGPREGGEDVR